MAMPGMSELMIIGAVFALLFGGKKLPELGGALGESIKNFKKGIKELEKDSALPEAKQAVADVKQEINAATTSAENNSTNHTKNHTNPS